MKCSPCTPAIDFSALKETSFIHTADWESIELKHKQVLYARLYQTYNRVLAMNEEGTYVTVTVTSSSDSLTIDDKFESYFNLMDYIQELGARLQSLAKEILDLQAKQQAGKLNIDETKEVNEQRRLALSLCLPVPMATAALLSSEARPQPAAAVVAA